MVQILSEKLSQKGSQVLMSQGPRSFNICMQVYMCLYIYIYIWFLHGICIKVLAASGRFVLMLEWLVDTSGVLLGMYIMYIYIYYVYIYTFCIYLYIHRVVCT